MRSLSLLCLFMVVFVQLSFAQHSTELAPGYYVVVAAYAPSRENVAQNYTETLNRKGLHANYGFNSTKNFYFVYLDYYATLKESLQAMAGARKNEEFAAAWVRVVPGDIGKEQPVAKLQDVMTRQSYASTEPTPIATPQPVKEDATTMELPTQVTNPQPDAGLIEITDNPPIKQYNPITLGNTEVFLSLYNAANNRIIDGNVRVVDTEKAKLLKEVKGNEYLLLPDPKSKSGQLTLICESFGYRKVQQEINYPLPLKDTTSASIDLIGTTFVINFDMVRYHAGDIATLYHVYFYNDAAVMLPESKYELNSLLEMMQEDPKYKIRLHGHTNGNYHGRIITMGDEKNFFSMDGSKNTVGSAKDLAYKRAEAIKEYLVANGIDASRIEIKSWGGKRPIYDKHSVNAKKNVRVEVEIL